MWGGGGGLGGVAYKDRARPPARDQTLVSGMLMAAGCEGNLVLEAAGCGLFLCRRLLEKSVVDSLSSMFAHCFALLPPQRKPDQCCMLPSVHRMGRLSNVSWAVWVGGEGQATPSPPPPKTAGTNSSTQTPACAAEPKGERSSKLGTHTTGACRLAQGQA